MSQYDSMDELDYLASDTEVAEGWEEYRENVAFGALVALGALGASYNMAFKNDEYFPTITGEEFSAESLLRED